MMFKHTFERLGWFNGILYLGSRALERLTSGRMRIVRYVLVAQPIGGVAGQPLRPDPATELRRVAEDDSAVADFPRPAPVLRRRYRAGARCTAAWVKGTFAGFIWIQRDAYDEDEVRCTYVLEDAARCVWDFDVYVEPRFRVGRTLARLWSHVDRELALEGVRWSISRISAFNPASLAAHGRLGVVTLATATFVQAGRWQLAWLPGRPFIHVCGPSGRPPRLRMRSPDPS